MSPAGSLGDTHLIDISCDLPLIAFGAYAGIMDSGASQPAAAGSRDTEFNGALTANVAGVRRQEVADA